MIARKKTYNSITRSFRSKTYSFNLFVFFLKMGDKTGAEARRETSSLKYGCFEPETLVSI